MAWNKKGHGGKGKGKKPRTQDSDEQPSYLKAVEPRWNLIKAALRGYASEQGSPFYAGQKQTEAEFLGLPNILNKMEPYTSEIVNRLGIALSEAGGTVVMGHELLEKYGSTPAETGSKLGVQGVFDVLKTAEGKAFVEAAATFDKNNPAAKDTAAVQKAAGKWVGFLLDKPKEKAKAMQRLVKSAARSYVLGMEILQWLAAAKSLPEWAKKFKARKELQPDKLQKWLRSPSDKERLIAALVASYQEQVNTAPAKTGQTLSESSHSDAGSAKSVGGGRGKKDGDSGSDAESSSDSDKKAKKKGKKASKKAGKKTKKEKKDPKKKSKKCKKTSSSKDSSSQKKSEEGSSDSVSPSTLRKRKSTALDKKEKKKQKKDKDAKETEMKQADALQKQALKSWQLSEIQSSQEEWASYSSVLRAKSASAETFAHHIGLIPDSVRAAFNIETDLPTTDEKIEALMEAVTAAHAKGSAVWKP